jgi:hypothetical protein
LIGSLPLKPVPKHQKSINYTEISVHLDKKKPCTNAGPVVYSERGDAVVMKNIKGIVCKYPFGVQPKSVKFHSGPSIQSQPGSRQS